MTDLEPLAEDAKKALGDIKDFHLMKFAGDVGNFIWMLPNAVSTCQKVEDIESDLQTVLTWAEILKSPLKVSKIAAKNWLFHGTTIKADIDAEMAAWTAADYYTSG